MSDHSNSSYPTAAGRGWIPASRDIGLPGESFPRGRGGRSAEGDPGFRRDDEEGGASACDAWPDEALGEGAPGRRGAAERGGEREGDGPRTSLSSSLAPDVSPVAGHDPSFRASTSLGLAVSGDGLPLPRREEQGWSPARKVRFLDRLSGRGDVRAAAAAVGMSRSRPICCGGGTGCSRGGGMRRWCWRGGMSRTCWRRGRSMGWRSRCSITASRWRCGGVTTRGCCWRIWGARPVGGGGCGGLGRAGRRPGGAVRRSAGGGCGRGAGGAVRGGAGAGRAAGAGPAAVAGGLCRPGGRHAPGRGRCGVGAGCGGGRGGAGGRARSARGALARGGGG